MACVALMVAACGGSGSEPDAPATPAAPTAAAPEAQPADAEAAADGASAAMTKAPEVEAPEGQDPPPQAPPELDIVQVAVWGEGGGFDFPNQIDVGPDGNVYLTEFSGSRVFKFSPGGEELARWGSPPRTVPRCLAADLRRPPSLRSARAGRSSRAASSHGIRSCGPRSPASAG